MRIGLTDIEDQIADKVAGRLCSPMNDFLLDNIHWRGLFRTRKRNPSPDEAVAYRSRMSHGQQSINRTIIGFLAPFLVALPVSIELGMSSPVFGIFSFGAVYTLGATAGLWWAAKASPLERLKGRVGIEEMRAVFPLLSITRAERVYCDTLLFLASMEVDNAAEVSVRGTLAQLNSLLSQSRKLENRRLSLLPVLGSNTVSELQKEFGDLGNRLDKTTDIVARESIEQSLRMCSVRMENARAFEQGLIRLNAQQEAIVHTIASVHSALARTQIAPELHTAAAAEEISHSVAEMSQQTYAVEQAVQEVMTQMSG